MMGNREYEIEFRMKLKEQGNEKLYQSGDEEIS